jgi:hypothetical protein
VAGDDDPRVSVVGMEPLEQGDAGAADRVARLDRARMRIEVDGGVADISEDEAPDRAGQRQQHGGKLGNAARRHRPPVEKVGETRS